MSTPTDRASARELATILTAYSDGHTIQIRARGTKDVWIDLGDRHTFTWNDFEYRIKPEPRYRPWKWNEVPLGAKCRSRIGKHDICTIMAVTGKGMFMCPTGHEDPRYTFQMDEVYAFEHLAAYREWFNEHSRTWEPCGVLWEEA